MSDQTAQRTPPMPNDAPTANGARAPGRRWMLAGLFALVVLFAIPAGTFAVMAPSALTPAAGSVVGTHLTYPSLVAHSASPALGEARTIVPGLRMPHLGETSLGASAGRSFIGPTSGLGLGQAPERPRALAGSTASNFLVANYSQSTSIASGASNVLLDAYTGIYGLTNGSSISTYTTIQPWGGVFTSGLVGVARSTNNGTTWTVAWPGLNSSWTSSSNPSYGSINSGPATIASDGSGNLLLADTYSASCFQLGGFLSGGSVAGCNSTANITAPEGISVARSTDNGISWKAPAVVQTWGQGPEIFLSMDIGSCGPFGNFEPFGNSTIDTPMVDLNPTNLHGVVTWTEEVQNLAGQIGCNSSGTQPFYYIKGGYIPSAISYTATTTDGGVTWSAPLSHGWNQSFSPAVGISPGPSYENYLAYMDYHNGTSSGIPIAFSNSTDNGSTWTKAADIPGLNIIPPVGLSDSSSTITFPGENTLQMAVDDSATSPHVGTIYLVWNDNRSTNNEPSIEITRSSNHGRTWTAGTYITPQTTQTLFVEPTVTVDPNGAIWVQFYGINAANGNYRAMAVVSYDGGVSWSAPFAVSDTDSLEPGAGAPFGATSGITANGNGVFPAWADCRDAACVTGGNIFYEHYAYSANLQTVGVNATISGVNETLTALGTTTNVALSTSLARTVWEVGSSVTVSVPPFAPDNGVDVWAFSHWSGASTSSQDPVVISPFNGSSQTLTAVYVASPGAWIAGFVGPVVAGLAVTVNAVPVLLAPHNATTEGFNVTVPAGPAYTTTISAGGPWYIPYSETDPTSALHTVSINRILSRTTGYINGTVSPSNGAVFVNGTPITVGAGGLFSDAVVWGEYTVTGSLTGFTAFSQTVNVTPHATVGVTVSMSGAVITGTVSPGNALVEVDGNPIVVAGGSFATAQLPAGLHHVTSTIAGYSLYSREISTTAGQTSNVNILLTNKGWINGTITPSTGRVQLNNQYYSVVNGAYNISVVAGHTYEIKGVLAGYDNGYNNATVSAGNVSYANLTLQKSTGPGGCTTNCPPPPPSGGSNVTLSNSGLYLYLGLGLVAVVVIALAAVMLLRRGRGGSGSEAPPAEPETMYDGSDPSQLPKLQSDGTMDGPPPGAN